jgi:hypothetical protein
MRRQVTIALIAGLALGSVLSGRSLHSGDDDDNGDNSRIQQGLAIAPVHLNLKGKNRALVGLGSYIVNAQSGCANCHSCPTYASGHNPFRGQPKQMNAATYLAGGVPFGPFTSRNITPDEDTGKLELTFAQFKEVLRKGTDFDHAHPQFGPLLQVMPWPVFQDMTDHDIQAIYEYLRSIPHAEPGSCSQAGEGAP